MSSKFRPHPNPKQWSFSLGLLVSKLPSVLVTSRHKSAVVIYTPGWNGICTTDNVYMYTLRSQEMLCWLLKWGASKPLTIKYGEWDWISKMGTPTIQREKEIKSSIHTPYFRICPRINSREPAVNNVKLIVLFFFDSTSVFKEKDCDLKVVSFHKQWPQIFGCRVLLSVFLLRTAVMCYRAWSCARHAKWDGGNRESSGVKKNNISAKPSIKV